MRDSFVFYSSFYDAIQMLDNENAGACIKALANYALNGEMPEDKNPMVMMFFTLVKPQIDANNQKYENGKLGAEYGKLGGRPKKENPRKTTEKPQENPKQTPNVNVNDNVNVNVFKKEKIQKEKRIFQKPKLEDVIAYCRERNNNVDPEKWLDYYESNGWKVGRNSMKDWRAAVRTWEKSSYSASASCKTADDAEFWAKVKREAESYERENQAN